MSNQRKIWQWQDGGGICVLFGTSEQGTSMLFFLPVRGTFERVVHKLNFATFNQTALELTGMDSFH